MYLSGIDAFYMSAKEPHQLRRFTTPVFLGNSANQGQNENPVVQDNQALQQVDGKEENSVLKANRWSKHAPDAKLPTEDFRNQLKQNMKGELESRRASLPNRGNQPAKHYLDSL